MQIKICRRNNLRKLAKQLGGVSQLAKRLNRVPAQISHLIGANTYKNIGDQLATSIEIALGLPAGWLDQAHEEDDLEAYAYDKDNAPNIPILADHEVLNWLQKPMRSTLQRNLHFIKTNLQLSKHAFALCVNNDVLEAPTGISIPRNSIVIADPEISLKNNAYVVICLDKKTPQISQLVQEGSRRYLSPPNPRYPIIELTSPHYIICGILRQVVINL